MREERKEESLDCSLFFREGEVRVEGGRGGRRRGERSL